MFALLLPDGMSLGVADVGGGSLTMHRYLIPNVSLSRPNARLQERFFEYDHDNAVACSCRHDPSLVLPRNEYYPSGGVQNPLRSNLSLATRPDSERLHCAELTRSAVSSLPFCYPSPHFAKHKGGVRWSARY
jgi:hypothetical protein